MNMPDRRIEQLWRDAMWHAERAETLFGYARILYREYKDANLYGTLLPWQAGILYDGRRRCRRDAMMHQATANAFARAAWSQHKW